MRCSALPSLALRAPLLLAALALAAPSASAEKPRRDRQGVVAGRLLGGHAALALTAIELTLDLTAWKALEAGAARTKYVVQNDGAAPVEVALQVVAPPAATVVVTANGQPVGASRAPAIDAAQAGDADDFEPGAGAPFTVRFAPGKTELLVTHALQPTLWGTNAIATVVRVVHATKPKGPWKSVAPASVHVVRPQGFALAAAPKLNAVEGALQGPLPPDADLVQVRAQRVRELAATVAGPMGGFMAFGIAFGLALAYWAASRRRRRTSRWWLFAFAAAFTALGCAAAFGIQLLVLQHTGVSDPGPDWYRYAAMQYGASFVLATLVVFAFLAAQNAKRPG